MVKTTVKLAKTKSKVIQQKEKGPVTCTGCQKNNNTKHRKDLAMIFCNGNYCQKEVPENHFFENDLLKWREHDQLYVATCARCRHDREKPKHAETMACYKCKRDKRIVEFPAVHIKEWMTPRATVRKWACFECLFPACTVCKIRPDFAVPHNAVRAGKYWCNICKFPPCANGCGASRPQQSLYHVEIKPEWICASCRHVK